uniref:non-specific protein-tyrosine kinase n=1 Tax=Solibacter usitatus (strain Ellin6076) TaxID=234267 RepID=Q01X01_SOLUE
MECARTLYRRKATVLWITFFAVIAAALISVAQPRMYESQASIQVQGVNENFLNLRDIFPTAAPSADSAVYVQTQAEMLQQDALLERVVKKLRLEDRPEYQRSSSLWDRLRPGTSQAPVTRTAVDEVRKNLQIISSRGTSIIRIVAEAREPQLAADLANTLAQTFIEQSIEARQRSAQQTFASLSGDLKEIRNRALQTESDLNAYGRGKRAAGRAEGDGNREFYDAMARRANEASVASTLRQSNVRLVDPAQPATHHHKPNVPLNLLFGLFGGLALATGYVMLQEQTNSALRSPGDAGAYLTLPELGAIPRAAKRKFAVLGFLSESNGKSQVERASLEQPASHVSESFRATLASILSSSHNGDHPHVLVVTSSRPMEGKTTVVSNLGIALAEIGNRVLLIDGDLRRPRLHKVFDQANSWGLSDLLREKNAIEDLPLDVLVKKTAVPRLSLLPSGTGTDNIFGLLCSGRMARLLPRFRQEFDYVIVDAPPCLEFADARIISRYTERLLLVVRADYTDRKTAQAAVQRLLLDGISVMGVIFNYWDPTVNDLYSYAQYHQDIA